MFTTENNDVDEVWMFKDEREDDIIYTHRDGSPQPLTQTQYRGDFTHTFFSKFFLTPVGRLEGTHATEL